MARPRTKDTGAMFTMRWTEPVKSAVATHREKLQKQHPGMQISMTDAARDLIMVGSAVTDKPGGPDGE